ncbi:endonuclease/exonuclease/phosphatase family protein [Nanchangia anserum]|uniref:Endonuclease/exonuclease/phosphatase family protein n=1 Tax=Nanchangia anserum TaxID=2692125 RepID=A0A8I0GG54_9ACTO|nr:exodeoxyribonuclease III [Nanchangia anserum]MBD3689419.1 endonuclease/exonuclease/phosphatase family protein [Nanchangia anserum]QOX81625.1 endonuclease/exonuclease/phosphatase family protein [Nanchangia anserum]
MRLGTWNVNSARTRIDRIVEVLTRHDLDVLAIQETKCRTDQFPIDPLREAGYDAATWGINQWNGVAVISRVGLDDVTRGFPGQPTFRDTLEPRALGVTCAGVRVWSLYVPHGRGLTDPHMAYKLAWFEALRAAVSQRLDDEPDLAMALVGDFNVAPLDSDVWDIAAFEGATHVSDAERQAFAALADAGLREVSRDYAPGYTYWDYQKLRFPRNEGMKIDFAYASTALAQRVTGAVIDRDERKGKGASDHVPLILDIADEA